MAEDIQELKRQINAMEPHERLTFAGLLLSAAVDEPDPARKLLRTRSAYAIARDVVAQLGAALAVHDAGGRRG